VPVVVPDETAADDHRQVDDHHRDGQQNRPALHLALLRAVNRVAVYLHPGIRRRGDCTPRRIADPSTLK